MVALSATSVAKAAWLDVELFGGVHHEGAVRRQLGDLTSAITADADSATSPTAAATTSATTEETTTEDESTTATTPTEEPTTTTEEVTTPTTEQTTDPTTTTAADPTTTTDTEPTTTDVTQPSEPTTTTTSPTSTSTDGSGAGAGSSPSTTTTQKPSTTRAPTTSTSSFTSVVTEVTVIRTTNSVGQETSFETQTTRTSTGAALVTTTPDPESDNPGMDDGTKRTIIGVTVGVGGAIVLGVAGLLFMRLRNKRRSGEESEDLVSYGNGFGGPGTAEKSETATNPSSGRSPFQSTLESYHAPTQTNAASNF